MIISGAGRGEGGRPERGGGGRGEAGEGGGVVLSSAHHVCSVSVVKHLQHTLSEQRK